MEGTETEDRAVGGAARQMQAANEARLVDGPEVAGAYGGVPESVEAAGAHLSVAKEMSGEQALDAMEWLLSDDPWGGATPKATYEVNVGTDEQARVIQWSIRPVDADEMNVLRQQARAAAAGGNRQARRKAGRTDDNDFDVVSFNRRMVALATIEPDLVEAAASRGVTSADPLEGPSALLARMFQHKPGLLDQLAGHVMRFSGFDEDDVARATPEATMVKATGNS